MSDDGRYSSNDKIVDLRGQVLGQLPRELRGKVRDGARLDENGKPLKSGDYLNQQTDSQPTSYYTSTTGAAEAAGELVGAAASGAGRSFGSAFAFIGKMFVAPFKAPKATLFGGLVMMAGGLAYTVLTSGGGGPNWGWLLQDGNWWKFGLGMAFGVLLFGSIVGATALSIREKYEEEGKRFLVKLGIRLALAVIVVGALLVYLLTRPPQ